MPVGCEATVPVPVLDAGKVTRSSFCSSVQRAVTLFAASMVTVHGPVVLVHAPVQPPKVEVAAGFAVSCTMVLWRNDAVQPAHAMPAGLELTVPEPVPVDDTVSA